MGAADQVRMVGSVLALAIVTSVFNGHVRPLLDKIDISGGDIVADTAQHRGQVSVHLQEQINMILAEGYNEQMMVVTGFAAAQLLTVLLMWRKKQVTAS